MKSSIGGMSNPAGAFSSWMMRRTKLVLSSTMPSRPGVDAAEAEEKAARQIWELKTVLRSKATSEEFWQVLVEGMVEITGAQAAFVSRSLSDDDKNQSQSDKDPEVESMMAIAYLYDDGRQKPRVHRNIEYETSQGLAQDRVVLVPHSLAELHPHTPKLDPLDPNEAYLAVPIWNGENEWFAQMGLIWTRTRIKSRPRLSWSYLTMFLHALEDMVQKHITMEIASQEAKASPGDADKEVPHCCKISLKPYARNVSHELRTPMQGVVGTLDLLHASILEICQTEPSKLAPLIEGMLENIEVAQDSSMRAIYAADNMVHAYDLDMEIPSVSSSHKSPKEQVPPIIKLRRKSLSPIESPEQVERLISTLDISLPASPKKQQLRQTLPRVRPRSYSSPPQGRLALESPFKRLTSIVPTTGIVSPATSSPTPPGTVALIFDAAGQVLLNSRPVKLRGLLHDVIHECLRIGGRPDTVQIVEKELGEIVTVLMKGKELYTTIILNVAYEVPDFIIVDELALKKLLSCVFHNAVKYAEGGKIFINVSIVHPSSRFVIFSIADTGCGIKSAFLPNLFKPFSREDTTITRNLDGLGLGLMVAKGLARKMGGDVWCEWTSTKGPLTGTEFRIKLPTSPVPKSNSLPGTPLKTPGAFIHSGVSELGLELEPLVGSLKLDVRRLTPCSTLKKVAPEGPSSSTGSCSNIEASRDPISPPPLPNSPPLPTLKATPAPITLPPAITPISDLQLPSSNLGLETNHAMTSIGRLDPGLRVLITEDNSINRRLLALMLHKLGIAPENIFSAADGLEAIKIIEEDRAKVPGGTISLVLMDIWMPKCDGYEATKRILELDRQARSGLAGKRKVKIFAVSADVTREAGRKAMEMGMCGFMGKPYRIMELRKVLLEHVGNLEKR